MATHAVVGQRAAGGDDIRLIRGREAAFWIRWSRLLPVGVRDGVSSRALAGAVVSPPGVVRLFAPRL